MMPGTYDAAFLETMTFEELGVKPELVKALHELGIDIPTEIQKKAILPILSGKDLIGRSKTGSGKTAAFGVPLLQRIVPRKGLQAVILSPTRELACQIAEELGKFSRYLPCSIATVYGGVSLQPQVQQIARADILVGTPGRVLDHLHQRTLNLSTVGSFVLDEADKMVEMGFIEDVEAILSFTPRGRQMLLFGATLSSQIDQLTQRYLQQPIIAEAEVQVEEEFLTQYYYDCQPQEKFSLLFHLLQKEEIGQAIIFCSSRSTVELVQKNLRLQGIKAEMIHGKLSQNRRLAVIRAFNQGKQSILVASPVAARGLDIKGVTHVFNYDLSRDPQEYIHRIGRTARAGETGKAITLLSQKDYDTFNEILRFHRVTVEELPREPFVRMPFDARSDRPRGPFGGQFRGRGPAPRRGFDRGERRNERDFRREERGRFPPRSVGYSRGGWRG